MGEVMILRMPLSWYRMELMCGFVREEPTARNEAPQRESAQKIMNT